MRERSPLRSVGLFVAGMLVAGAFALTPVGAGVRDGIQGFFKKADRRYEQGITFSEKMNVGDPDRMVARLKPFTLVARCDIAGGEEVRGMVYITTSRDNAYMSSVADHQDDFDRSDNANPVAWAEESGFPPGGPPSFNGGGAFGRAMAPRGQAYHGSTSILTNAPKADCIISGHVTKVG